MKKGILCVLALACVCGFITGSSAEETVRVSVDSSGTEGDGDSWYPAISSDVRYVVFDSDATSLVTGDTNGKKDIFLHDRTTGETTRVSVDSAGTEGDGNSYGPSISSDGHYVVFASEASNLVTGDTNGVRDIFMHDRSTSKTTRVSVDSFGAEGDGKSYVPSISPDGRYMVFSSVATNLVAGDTNGKRDIFVHVRTTEETTRVSVDSSGTEGDGDSLSPAISPDGSYAVFWSEATNLVAGDINGKSDVFVHDRTTGETTRVSVTSSGTEGDGDSYNPSVSSDVRYVVFDSDATNLVTGDTNGKRDIFLHDRTTGETTRVSVDSSGTEGDGDSYNPSVSSGGRYVAFQSDATNLVAGDTNGKRDVFVHDRTTGETTRISVTSSGTEGDGDSEYPSISSDGRYVAFSSEATSLVAGDTNVKRDVFVHDQAPNNFTAYIPSSEDNGIDGDGKSSVIIFWDDSTSSDVDHYEIVASTRAAPDETDTVEGQDDITPGTQTATFDWSSGDVLYVGVVAVDTMGFRNLSLNRIQTYVTVVDDTVTTTTTADTTTSTVETTSTSTSTTTADPTFTISGTVTGAVSADVPIYVTGAASQTVHTDASGNYQFSGLASGYYILTPELDCYAFEPPNREIPLLTGDTSGMDFVARWAPCAVQKIYGTDSGEIELLRVFRDEVLSQTPVGQKIIELYYAWSPVIVRAMEENEELEKEVKNILDGVLTAIRTVTE